MGKAKTKQVRSVRTRYLSIVCYSEPLPLIRYYDPYQWAYILHDKDYDKDGNLIEPQYHLYLRLHNAVELEKQAKKVKSLDIMQGNVFFQACYSPTALLQYFTHSDCPSKTVYSSDCIKSSFDVSQFISRESKALEKANKSQLFYEDCILLSQGKINQHEFIKRDFNRVYQMPLVEKICFGFRNPQVYEGYRVSSGFTPQLPSLQGEAKPIDVDSLPDRTLLDSPIKPLGDKEKDNEDLPF